jgi:hypothetical protein
VSTPTRFTLTQADIPNQLYNLAADFSEQSIDYRVPSARVFQLSLLALGAKLMGRL